MKFPRKKQARKFTQKKERKRRGVGSETVERFRAFQFAQLLWGKGFSMSLDLTFLRVLVPPPLKQKNGSSSSKDSGPRFRFGSSTFLQCGQVYVDCVIVEVNGARSAAEICTEIRKSNDLNLIVRPPRSVKGSR